MTDQVDEPAATSSVPDAAPGGPAEGWTDHQPGQESEPKPAPGTLPPDSATAPPTQPVTSPPGWSDGVPYTQGPAHAPTGHPTGLGTHVPAPGRSQLLPWVVIGALLILIVILLGALNARDYHLVRDGDRVVVKRGGWILGTTRDLADNEVGRQGEYAPIELPAGVHVEDARFGEREDLKRAMVDLILKILKPVVAAGDMERVEALGQRLDAFRIPTDILHHPAHRKLFARVAMVRGHRAEGAMLDGLMKARQHFQQAQLLNDPAARQALGRLHRIEGLLQRGAAESLSQSEETGKDATPEDITEF
ncbi:MAG: hypothetical protein CMH55_02235 [Myxococcales bacterium]|nr:hypothetical protein [Myxococcales bacterium]